ncbi:inositol monophosphatase family protein [Salinispora vitiensis]|uniref:inositol monophosphatase family protein n=1 Tax=Salinispora vitiensis TaxID=999544 RepID=UPI000373961F|nr:inositol monophosphatase family protein [Salinispora vitiensis]
MPENLFDEVGTLLRTAADQVVLPLFRRLDEADIEEKAPGDLVTVADRRAEELISAGLRRLRPDSVVVGEEAVAEDPELLRHLDRAGPVWLVDPIDGTSNFAAGRPPFVLMVALLIDGEPSAAWMLDPLVGTLAATRPGTGAYVNGRAVRTAGAPADLGQLRGAAMSRYLPAALRPRVEAAGARLGELLPGQHCAGREYLDLLLGVQQFVLYGHTLPWDHVPGTHLVRAAGGVARRFDGAEYHPGVEGQGLLVAVDERVWAAVREAFFGGA